jgi:broad specificity phosphatase PhoE
MVKVAVPGHPVRLILLRHGEVEERYHRVFGGCRIDMGLSPLGRVHGECAADWLLGQAPDVVYRSPMRRVEQTIGPFLERSGFGAVVMEGLREVDFGDWTGLRWHEVQERFGISAFDWLHAMDADGIRGGEGTGALFARVRPCVERILADNAGRSVVVACHGGIVRAVLALLLGWPMGNFAAFDVDYGSLTVVDIDPAKGTPVQVKLLNYCPWHESNRATGEGVRQ